MDTFANLHLSIKTVVAGRLRFSGGTLNRSLAIGIIFYLVYIIWIGGDFMEGRFLTPPFFLALIILAQALPGTGVFILAPLLVFFGGVTMDATILSSSTYTNSSVSRYGIADERGFYYQDYGLLTGDFRTYLPPQWKVSERAVEVTCGGLGFRSIHSGPGTHFIDECGLTDPLLARLPAKDNPNWRAGHFVRQLPTDYVESISKRENLLADPAINSFWNSIRIVTRGPLLDKDRILEILRINLGIIKIPDFSSYKSQFIPRSSEVRRVTQGELNKPVPDGTLWNALNNVTFGINDNSIEIIFDGPLSIASIDISLDNNDVYEILMLRDQEWLPAKTTLPSGSSGMTRHKITLEKVIHDVRKLRVIAHHGDGNYSIGHVLINND